MKRSPVIIGGLIMIYLYVSCDKDNLCPISRDIGQLTWSKETEKWFPNNYLSKPSTIEFENHTGSKKVFILDTVGIHEGNFFTVDMFCPNNEGTTRTRYAQRQLFGRFVSADSIAIDFGMGVWNEISPLSDVVEPDFYEWVSATVKRLNHSSGDWLGRVRIVTELRNSELDEITGNPNLFMLHEHLTIGSSTYSKVYSSIDSEYLDADMYFIKGIGVLAFFEESGDLWIRKN